MWGYFSAGSMNEDMDVNEHKRGDICIFKSKWLFVIQYVTAKILKNM